MNICVSPQSRAVFPDYQCAVGTGKIAEIFSYFKIIVYIFGIMKIRCGHHIEINALFLHLLPKKCKSVLNHFVFHVISILYIS